MNFEQAVTYLYGLERFGWKLGLERMRSLMQALGNPQDTVRYIHIAGTNGKGSVAAMVESILRSAGYCTGLYTSPHLQDVRERVKLNGEMITKQEFAAIMTRLQPVCDALQCTFFEVITALAFVAFAERQVDFVALETGLGGRLDATNIIRPEVSVITSIDLEHTEHLGTEIAMIAYEKAGIIKSGVPCVVGQVPTAAEQVIMKTCAQNACTLVRAEQRCRCTGVKVHPGSTDFDLFIDEQFTGKVTIPLPGWHQAANAQLAVTAITELRNKGVSIQPGHIINGLDNVNWPGRFQTISKEPYIIADVAHNPASFQQLVNLLKQLFTGYQINLIFGLLKDKDLPAIAGMLKPVVHGIYAVQANSDRSVAADIIAREFGKSLSVQSFSTVKAGLVKAIQEYRPGQLLCVAGSHYVVGEVLDEIKTLTS